VLLAAAPLRVNDEGKFFSSGAIGKANQKIGEIHREFNKDLIIETVPAVPAETRAQLKAMEGKSGKQGRSEFFKNGPSSGQETRRSTGSTS
jgi:hypothetical protein